jgi:hypothetical protein
MNQFNGVFILAGLAGGVLRGLVKGLLNQN